MLHEFLDKCQLFPFEVDIFDSPTQTIPSVWLNDPSATTDKVNGLYGFTFIVERERIETALGEALDGLLQCSMDQTDATRRLYGQIRRDLKEMLKTWEMYNDEGLQLGMYDGDDLYIAFTVDRDYEEEGMYILSFVLALEDYAIQLCEYCHSICPDNCDDGELDFTDTLAENKPALH